MTLVRTVLVWDRRAWSSLQPLHVASAENSVTPGPLPAPLDSLRAGAADNLALGRGTASAFSTLDSAAGSDRCVALRPPATSAAQRAWLHTCRGPRACHRFSRSAPYRGTVIVCGGSLGLQERARPPPHFPRLRLEWNHERGHLPLLFPGSLASR